MNTATTDPEHRDSPDTRLRKICAEQGLAKEQTQAILREASDILAVSPEIVRLRAINRGLVDSHNGMLRAYTFAEDRARELDEALEAARDDFSTSSLLLAKQAGYALTRLRGRLDLDDSTAEAFTEVQTLIANAVALHEKKAPRD